MKVWVKIKIKAIEVVSDLQHPVNNAKLGINKHHMLTIIIFLRSTTLLVITTIVETLTVLVQYGVTQWTNHQDLSCVSQRNVVLHHLISKWKLLKIGLVMMIHLLFNSNRRLLHLASVTSFVKAHLDVFGFNTQRQNRSVNYENMGVKLSWSLKRVNFHIGQ